VGAVCLLHPPPLDITAFSSLVLSFSKSTKSPPSRFVKKLDKILKVLIHPTNLCSLALWLVKNGLIEQFTCI
jgi:hypothetical protein